MHNNIAIPTWGKATLVLAPIMVLIVGMASVSWHTRQQRILAREQVTPQVKLEPADFQSLSYPRFDDLKTIPNVVPPVPQKNPQSDTHLNHTNVANQGNAASSDTESESDVTEEQIKQAIAQVKQNTSTRQSEGDAPTQRGDDALRHLDLSKLSPSLQSRVQAALKSESAAREQGSSLDAMDIRQHINEFTGQLPPLNFQSHVYTTDVIRRWIKVNGVEYRQGDNLGPGIQLLDIKPQSTVIKFHDKLIEIPALYDWKG
ncbi:MAG: general secretion pathway protein GspB [Vibrio sp.]